MRAQIFADFILVLFLAFILADTISLGDKHDAVGNALAVYCNNISGVLCRKAMGFREALINYLRCNYGVKNRLKTPKTLRDAGPAHLLDINSAFSPVFALY